jgi:hypothetical protein
MKPMVRMEIGVTHMQVRVPCIHIGDNSAQIKAMRLANVQTFESNVWRPNRVLSTPQIDSICGVDRKMVIFMCICIILSQINHDFSADTQINFLRWFSFEFLRVRVTDLMEDSFACLE